MQKYKYTATDKTGKKIKGNFVANSEAEMKEMLMKAGYFVTSSRQISSADLSNVLTVGKVKVNELSQFCNQFSVMISAGISIVEAINVSVTQSYSSKLKNALVKIQEDLKQGLLLSEAMAKHPKIFPEFFSSMVYVGETAGCLDVVLVSVAQYYELEQKTKKKIIGALIYPLILLVMLIGVVIIMLGFVIPTFITSLSKMETEMPAITMAVFNLSLFFQDYGVLTILIVIILIFALVMLRFVPSVREFYDKLKVKLPVFKRINLSVFTSRFCRSLGLLLSSGADSLSALISLRKTISNKYLGKQFDRVINNVKIGMPLSSALAAEMNVSPILIQMIIVGEKTGELAEVLNRTAPYFDAQTEASLNVITTTVQPTVIILLGGIIAVLFVAMYSPILSIIQSVQV